MELESSIFALDKSKRMLGLKFSPSSDRENASKIYFSGGGFTTAVFSEMCDRINNCPPSILLINPCANGETSHTDNIIKLPILIGLI